jgi:hypothetical protein
MDHPKVDLTQGNKLDQNKVRMDLLSAIAIEEIAKVMTFGAHKYEDHNWRKGIKWSRVLAALLRHVFAYMRGERHDPETGLSHMAHAGCCVMFILEFEKTHQQLNDLYACDSGTDS